MKLFQCQNCGQPLYFEHMACESCGLRLGYLPEQAIVSALEEVDGAVRALAALVRAFACAPTPSTPSAIGSCAPTSRRPSVRRVGTIGSFPISPIRRTSSIGARSSSPSAACSTPCCGSACRWRRAPRIPTVSPSTSCRSPVGTGGEAEPVMTGHKGGLITLNLAEADDPERERQRQSMGEPYRTLLGHFRHEIAHYYWDQLVRIGPRSSSSASCSATSARITARRCSATTPTGRCRTGPSASSRPMPAPIPWEDFAETWAHYFHMVDTLETAFAFGLRLRPRVAGADLAAAIDFDPHLAGIDRIVDAWLAAHLRGQFDQPQHGATRPLSVRPSPASVIWKLTFVHERIHAVGSRPSAPPEPGDALRAVVAGLQRPVGSRGRRVDASTRGNRAGICTENRVVCNLRQGSGCPFSPVSITSRAIATTGRWPRAAGRAAAAGAALPHPRGRLFAQGRRRPSIS